MATNGEMQIPVRKRAPWHDDASCNVVGSNLGASKGFIKGKSLLNFTCVYDNIVEDFVLRMIVNNVNVSIVPSADVADVLQIE